MNFHQILRPLVPERKIGRQDGLQNVPRSTQDGSKRLLKSIFYALENRLKFGLVLGAILGRFWLPNPSQKTWATPPLFCILKAFIFEVLFASLQEGPRGTQEGPRGAQEARGSLQERPKRLQEASKSAPGGSNRASRDLKSRSRGLKTRPRGAKSFPRRPQSFSEAPGPAAVFGKMKKLKAYAHKVFPKHLVQQPFSEKWKHSKHGSKRHRRHLESPKSVNPKGLAPIRRMKKRRAGGGGPPWGSE